ncbi:MAG TPA: hypothetical protein VNT33_05380 [Telluria sp.]|nr:hypothetical protein [Telluria sp.]
MSVAVSVTVVPSRRLRALLAAFGVANLGAALAAGLLPGRFLLAPATALACLACAAALLRRTAHFTKTRRIDISGLGQFRLTVQQGLGTNDTQNAPAGQPVTLAAGSTAWPQLLLLLLHHEGGALTVLPVLPDSVTAEGFRALSVAVRAAGGRDDPEVGAHKIL